MNLKSYVSKNGKFNCIILLGPTACGKTALGVRIADMFCKSGIKAHIVSADSRQVYKGLDIGSGKDLSEFVLDKGTDLERKIEYHLIDIVDVKEEYNVYRYQNDFYKVFNELQTKQILPIVVGGTGMYLDSIVRSYKMGQVGTNICLRQKLQGKNIEQLTQILFELKQKNGRQIHNTTDTLEHHRLLRAIEIETWNAEHNTSFDFEDDIHACTVEPYKTETDRSCFVRPLILGTTFDRSVVRQRVTERLKQRLEQGMMDEVKRIHDSGISWERLERLGLEYKFVSQYFEGKITNEQLFSGLNTAIHQFAKRQETWFRGMERKGVKIIWLPKNDSRFDFAIKVISENLEYL
ncbi:MAG: tRNA (adenosine(37)-N6)-dimethylallyltransferase [Treponemataceae bacterium]